MMFQSKTLFENRNVIGNKLVPLLLLFKFDTTPNLLIRKLLGAWCFGGKRRPGGQSKTLRKSYLDLLRKLQFDTNDTTDSALCGSHGTLRNILELICNEPVDFNLRLYHGLNGDVREGVAYRSR